MPFLYLFYLSSALCIVLLFVTCLIRAVVLYLFYSSSASCNALHTTTTRLTPQTKPIPCQYSTYLKGRAREYHNKLNLSNLFCVYTIYFIGIVCLVYIISSVCLVYSVCLICLVYYVCLVCLICLVYSVCLGANPAQPAEHGERGGGQNKFRSPVVLYMLPRSNAH